MNGNSTIEYAICKDDFLDKCQYTSYNISTYADNQTWRFGNQDIPTLTDNEKESVLTLPSEEREKFIAELYNLNYQDVKRYIELAS